MRYSFKLLLGVFAISTLGVGAPPAGIPVGLSSTFLKSLSQRPLTLPLLDKMLSTPVQYEEVVLVSKLGLDGNATKKQVAGNQLKEIHNECLAKWTPFLKKVVEQRDEYLRTMGVTLARLELDDDTAGILGARDPSAIFVDDKGAFTLSVRIDKAERCEALQEQDAVLQISNWRNQAEVRAAFAAVYRALRTLEPLSDKSKAFIQDLEPLKEEVQE